MPVGSQHPGMSEKSAPKPGKPKPNRSGFKYVRVREPAATLAANLAEADLKNLTDWVNEAVVERLRSLGKWPPSPS